MDRSLLTVALCLLTSSMSTFGAQVQEKSLTYELIELCKQNSPDIEEARKLLQDGALMGEPDTADLAPFDWAILRGHVALCELFFEKVEENTPPPSTEETRIDHNYSEYACIKERSYGLCIKLVQMLKDGQNSLTKMIEFLGSLYALERHGPDRLRYLFDDIMHKYILKKVHYGMALRYAVVQGNATLVQELIRTGISLTTTFDDLNMSDEVIARLSNCSGSEAIEILREAGAVRGLGVMPWHNFSSPTHSLKLSSAEATQQLLELVKRNKPIDTKTVKHLLNCGAHTLACDEEGISILQWALINEGLKSTNGLSNWGYTRELTKHMSKRASLYADRSFHDNANHIEAFAYPKVCLPQEKGYNREWVVSFLYCDRRYHYTQALHYSLRDGNTALAAALIAAGTSSLVYNDKPSSAQIAVAVDNPVILRILIERGDEIGKERLPYCEGLTLLHSACINGSWDCLQLLLERGAVFNRVSSYYGHDCHCYHLLNEEALEQFKIRFVKASLRRYLPTHEEVLEALTLVQKSAVLLNTLTQTRHMVYDVIEHTERLKNAVVTVFLYALNCSHVSLKTLFAQNVRNQELRSTMADLMCVLFSHMKDDPILLDYLYAHLATELKDVDIALTIRQMRPEVREPLELDEAWSTRILAREINERYNKTIGKLVAELKKPIPNGREVAV